MKTYKIIEPNYDVSGGDTSFESIEFAGIKYLIIQFYYTSLNQIDHKIRLQESLDGKNFVNSLDSCGSNIEITINNAISTDILRVIDFNTAYFRLQFIEGTSGTGTIDLLKIMME
jgi:hypothetical protein